MVKQQQHKFLKTEIKKMDFISSEAFDCYDRWLKEDVGNGDYSSLSSIPEDSLGESTLILKDDGVVAGL